MKNYAVLAILFFAFIIVYFLYHGYVTPPSLGDSHDYHLPIARSILNGTFINLPKGLNPSIYYPGSSNAILSLFLLFHIHVNYFCLLGWIILFFLCKKLGKYFGLDNYLATIYAATFCACMSVLRQIITQSIDMWIAVFFVWSILLLEKPKKSWKYFALIGFSLGMIVGSKFSGPLYVIVLFVLYGRKFLSCLSFTRVISFVIPFSIFGLFWYIRNAVLYGNPLYPAPFLGLPGYKGFPLQDMLFWKTPFENAGLYKIFEAYISEYLIWGVAFIPVLVYVFLQIKQKTLLQSPKINKMMLITLFTFLASLMLPIPTHNIISNMRYLFPVFIPLILSVFLIAQKYKLNEQIALIALLNMVVVEYLIYHPKLIIIYFLIVFILLWKRKQTIDKIIAL
jgi:hypothetical protein